ncbi:50S ribosome-binding GTPase [Blastopirellula sp. JC732]|uniref:tRNA modification GTPase MnmE n=1 Tax=Blastopirellula sediminis TaxID=2894196 RepID=A0A9X1MIX3_9BACT|nr:GTPase [Blastopirellula sediminis]MCC9609525.1 50S ribosome-binding GTPase [Blastopirellula sediminis]MCC9627699.1 50S ribosome-binding GTPase [Blastopirellula sediminis]
MSAALEDTIVAIGSGASGALRGVVRISGVGAYDCVKSWIELCDPPESFGRTSAMATATARIADRQLACDLYYWPNERSYTRQPSIEIHTIGSRPLLEEMVAAACRHGARMAEPGEFTLRAFLAGRLDLTQAEAVLGVIDAEGDARLKQSLAQLAGGLSSPLADARTKLLELLAHLEAGLDFVEEDIEFITSDELCAQLEEARGSVDHALTQLIGRDAGDEMIKVVFCGAPNVGKSSLFNAIVGEEAAIVADLAGTTRDTLVRAIVIGGEQVALIDTAGQEEAAAGPLQSAQRLGGQQVERADLRVICWDAGREATEAERKLWDAAPEERRLLVFTKCDLAAPTISAAVATSSTTGEGIAELRKAIAEKLAQMPATEDATAARCRASLQQAAESLSAALTAAENGLGEELVAVEIRMALAELGRVVGAIATDDILDVIFSRFCIGK